MIHPLHITLGHMVLPAGAPTVILPKHLLQQLVLQGGQLLEDVQRRGGGCQQEDQQKKGYLNVVLLYKNHSEIAL